jgi:hypothetical protein
MITFERSSVSSNGRPGDEIDRVLRGYFQSEMPHPWPAFTLPRSVTVPASAPERSTRGSRWQLYSRLLLIAASLALFVGTQFLRPGYVPSPTKDQHTPDSATLPLDPNRDGSAGAGRNDQIIKDAIEFEDGESVLRVEAYPNKPNKR